jgi:flagellar protein FlaJ
MMYVPYLQFLSENPNTVAGKSIGTIVKDPLIGPLIEDIDFFNKFFDIVDFTLIGLILLFFIPAYLYRKDFNWRNSADNALPSFLREIGDAQKVGLPLPRAVIEASKREYGPLTEELRFMAGKMSWGVGFHESLLRMKKRINTRLFDRTSVLILEAERSGGSIDEVFEAAYNHVSELLGVRRERAAAMKSYTWIIYGAYVVFAFVMVVLLQSFFTVMAEQSALQAASGNQELVIPNLAILQLLFFHMLMIQGSFSGIVAGKMGSGDAYLGLTHNVVLLLIGYLIFKVLVIMI